MAVRTRYYEVVHDAKNCIAPDGDPSIERQMALRCLVTGSAPWPAGEVARAVFLPLRDYDLTQYRFFPWNRRALQTDNPALAGAVYASPASVLLVVVNLSDQMQSGRCALDGDVLGVPDLHDSVAQGVVLYLGAYEARVEEMGGET